MPVSGRYGNPAPSSPPVPVPERVEGMGTIIEFTGREPIVMPPPLERLRASMQARAEELRTQIASLQAAKDELALIERMLEVK